MTNSLINDFQQPAVSSPLVELYEVEKPNGTFAYITPVSYTHLRAHET